MNRELRNATTVAGANAQLVTHDRTLSVAGGRAVRRLRPDRRNLTSRKRLVRRVESEFREMPGQGLTETQAARLLGLPREICRRILWECVGTGSLQRTDAGLFRLPVSPP